MIEGLWSVKFMSNNRDYGAGVVVFETSRVFGGDSNFIYLGHYGTIRDGVLTGTIEVRQYGFSNFSIFGPVPWGTSFTLEFSGEIGEDRIEGEGFVRESPDRRAAFVFEKQADLP
jgi:T3SS negative regulator,GrlR